MAAQLVMDENSTPTVSPDTVSGSKADNEVWFEYTLTNVGDEAGAPINYYVTVDDLAQGTIVHSEFTNLDEPIAPGETNPVSCRIDPSALHGLIAGDYWVSLRNESGETLAAALLVVEP